MLLRNLYDSHVHWMSTGQIACELDLSSLKSPADFDSLVVGNKARRGGWIFGFGWDENRWSEARPPTRNDLDRRFPDEPVYFSRCDGHSAVTNTEGLRRLGLWDPSVENHPGGEIVRDAAGVPTGLLKEAVHYRCLERMSKFTDTEMRGFLIEGAKAFNAAGFTHVRDMAGSEALWNVAAGLEKDGAQNLHAEWNFTCENLDDFSRALAEAVRCRSRETALNKVAGIKFYYDGSLGSDTAFLSQPYSHRTDGARGLTCWTDGDAEQAIRRSWEAGLPVAVHAIGDEAADRIVELARRVSSSKTGGWLNLEHAQILRPETIQKMKGLHVTCHLQPCHWLTDRRWLDRKLGALAKYAFPWEALRRARIPFQFGSDSPIEKPSMTDNLRAVEESAAHGIPRLDADPLRFHVKDDPNLPVGQSRFEDGRAVETRIDGRVVFTAI